VFVPVWFFSALHVHQAEPEICCQHCCHDIIQSGHISGCGDTQLEKCIFCNFLALSYFVSVAICVCIVCRKATEILTCALVRRYTVKYDCVCLRGPPSLL
jgi:hypothetical protein